MMRHDGVSVFLYVARQHIKKPCAKQSWRTSATVWGIVNVLVLMPSPSVEVGRPHLTLPLRGHPCTCNLLPELKSLGHLLAILEGGKPVASWSEVLGDGTIRGEKPLGVH